MSCFSDSLSQRRSGKSQGTTWDQAEAYPIELGLSMLRSQGPLPIQQGIQPCQINPILKPLLWLHKLLKSACWGIDFRGPVDLDTGNHDLPLAFSSLNERVPISDCLHSQFCRETQCPVNPQDHKQGTRDWNTMGFSWVLYTNATLTTMTRK